MNDDREKIKAGLEKLAAHFRTELSDFSLAMYLDVLSGLRYAEVKVLVVKLMQTSKFMPQPADFHALIAAVTPPDVGGWPTARAAIALYSKIAGDERNSGLVFDEVEEAWGLAIELGAPSSFGFQALFSEEYDKRVNFAKATGQSRPNWRLTAGSNKDEARRVAQRALADGLITKDYAAKLLPYEGVSATRLIESAKKHGSRISVQFAEKVTGFRAALTERSNGYDSLKNGGLGSSLFEAAKPGHAVRTGQSKPNALYVDQLQTNVRNA